MARVPASFCATGLQIQSKLSTCWPASWSWSSREHRNSWAAMEKVASVF